MFSYLLLEKLVSVAIESELCRPVEDGSVDVRIAVDGTVESGCKPNPDSDSVFPNDPSNSSYFTILYLLEITFAFSINIILGW